MLRRRQDPIRHAFKAMGTKVELIAAPGSDLHQTQPVLARVRPLFAREDVRFSRFRPDSELCRERAGRAVGPRLRAVRHAHADGAPGGRDTDGLFDPTVLPALMAAGYDRDFAEVARATRDKTRGRGAPSDPSRVRRPDDQGRHRVRRLAGRRALTAPGCGSRLAPRSISVASRRDGPSTSPSRHSTRLPWAIVDAGGDLRIAGTSRARGIDVGDRGSGCDRRPRCSGCVWTRGRSPRRPSPSAPGRTGAHHVIDPRTSLPARNRRRPGDDVGAAHAREAEVWSKEALLRGPEILDRVRGCLVMASGEIVTIPGRRAGAAVPA